MNGRARATPAGASAWKLWRFRLLAALGAPAVLLAVLELSLRVFGYGCSTAFLLPAFHNGRDYLEQNPRFGWRFFGQRLARVPAPCSFSRTKPPNSVRIFVFGESAAFGDPQPQFGLPRMLEAVLSLRFPKAQFEVINTAMTAINSNVLLPIARDCASAGGDIWVIYAGNNEVVGPFGAGTVFGPRQATLPWIRASIAFKATRIGQLLDALRQSLAPKPAEGTEWGGMSMFLDQQIRSDAPELNGVYRHFEKNMTDLVTKGRRSGAAIVVGTVAVNLSDCPPFGSLHRPGMSEAAQAQWNQLYRQASDAQANGDFPQAAAHLAEAARLDNTFAELRFRQGQCAEALTDKTGAEQQFRAARDLDTLRFRCDSTLTAATRRLFTAREHDRILLADAESKFAASEAGPAHAPTLFYDHVHLTFEGNYQLACIIAARVQELLPPAIRTQIPGDQPWPSVEACARRLGWTAWSREMAWSAMLARLNRPPFVGQFDHAAEIQQVQAQVKESASEIEHGGLEQSRKLTQQALADSPEDPFLLHQLAALDQAAGDLPGAATAARGSVQILPTNWETWFQLGTILGQMQQYSEAATAFRRAFDLDPQESACLENLGQALEKLGQPEQALREYRRAVGLNPRYGPAWLSLGQALEKQGRQPESQACFQQALTNRIPRATDLAALARFCQSRGWLDAAATNYADALRLSPGDVHLRLEAGRNLSALGRHDQADAQFVEAVRVAPDYGPAHFLLGLELARAGQPAPAAEQFRKAVRLMPDLVEARLNLALALMHQGLSSEALSEFDEVLRRSPTNQIAITAATSLRARLAAPP